MINNINRNEGFTTSKDFDTKKGYDSWRSVEKKTIAKLMDTMVRFNPNLEFKPPEELKPPTLLSRGESYVSATRKKFYDSPRPISSPLPSTSPLLLTPPNIRRVSVHPDVRSFNHNAYNHHHPHLQTSPLKVGFLFFENKYLSHTN